MKTTTIALKILCFLFVIVLLACEKENDQVKPDSEVLTGEVLPPDNEPVEGWIAGVISESVFDEDSSQTTVSINRIPHTLIKFLELRDQIAHTPQGAIVMMIVALRIYQQYPVEGMKCLTANCTYPLIGQAPNNPGAYQGNAMNNITTLKHRLNELSHLPLIYYAGASPQNKYTPQAPPYQVELFANPHSYIASNDGTMRIKLFVKTLGADSARPVTVKKTGELYSVTEYSSLYLNPKPPL
jgi:hypothetical protein